MSKAAELAKAGETLTNQPSGRKNLVTNGAMQVAQRSVSETGLGAASGYFTCDRWRTTSSGDAGRYTMTQTADGPSGFANCLKLDCTTADTSIAAGELFILTQRFEGQDLQQIKKGTSDAELITVSFYVKANAAFTFGVELFDGDNSRQITKLFDTTTGWVRHELTFPADTTGALNDDNTNAFQLNFWIHAGATYAGGTLNTAAWASNTNANRAAGIDSFFSSTDNNFFITGIQMEVGPVATPFEHRSYGQELALCQRYFFIGCSSNDADTGGMANGSFRTTSNAQVLQQHPIAMRTNPTTALRASGSVVIHDTNDGNNINVTAIDAVVMQSIKSTIFGLTLASASGVVGEGCWTYSAGGTPGITFDAEL